ncbi:alcohol dehydrogenase catalytic domain-containing protein [Natronomonas salina]|uniref:alcohol dehydrogenase catalytic domain-containing protein n=1 Tax=Natronomonas salina TaxID=1710540 RepID=UPI0015B61B26|nr:alcohol dehydrogenase catalytic domain-containing protein [Natronomonas salina]QLD88593.1 alcohol dehydrogenase catalytic domain-containing protein [Natronomonas salina]
MRAARFYPGEGLRIEDVPRPEVGPGEVLVEVAACGVCHSDLHVLDGDLPLTEPRTLGHEVAGTVAETGEGVGLDVGTDVAVFGGWGCRNCEVCARGDDQLCNLTNWLGIGHDGGYAEYVRVPTADYCLPLDGLDPVEAAPLTDAALTPYRAIEKADVGPGDCVALVGIGGLGEFGVQLSRLRGCYTVAVDRDPAKLRRAESIGADATVDTSGSVPGEIRDAASGPVDAVVDFVGVDATLQWGVNVLGADGRLVLAGIGGGSVDFSWNPLVGSEVTYRTVQWGTPAELRSVLDLARQDRLETRTERVGIDEVPATLERLEAGDVDGRAVVVPEA